MLMIIFYIVLLIAVSYLVLEWSMFIPVKGNAAILMYHKVSESQNDSLTITVEYLRRQLDYIRDSKYKVVSFSELMKIEKSGEKLSEKYLLITFDDGYENNRDLLLPLLEEYEIPVTIFLTVGCIGKENEWDGGGEKLLSYENLKEMAGSDYVEFGIHSYTHKSFRDMNITAIADDIDKCIVDLNANEIPFIPVFTYPYGAYPKKDIARKGKMFEVFRGRGLRYALRIGNGLNAFPFKNPFEVKRINVRGSDSFLKFKVKLKKGHTKLFE